MSSTENQPFFTIIIPTRNRPELFKLALDSVLAQSFSDKEVIVVNDGSDPNFLSVYKTLEEQYTGQSVKFRYQIKRPNGHGQSYSMNTGAYVGTGKYLCFLDDDDFWIDNDHLQRAYDSILNYSSEVDAYYTNQDAYFSDESKQTQNVWIEDLAPKLNQATSDLFDAYPVNVQFLLSSGGFAHLNCSIVRRQLYLDIGGMDENIRYECDRDIYIRTIDAASHILYCPVTISKHNIPDPKKKDNMSTMVSAFEKYLYQIVIYEKAILLSEKASIRRFAKAGLSYIFKHISVIYLQRKDVVSACCYARKALSLKFSVKWWLHTIGLTIKALLHRTFQKQDKQH